MVVVDKLAGFQWRDASSGQVVRSTTKATTSQDDYYAPANVDTEKVFFFAAGSDFTWQITSTDADKSFHAIVAELLGSSSD